MYNGKQKITVILIPVNHLSTWSIFYSSQFWRDAVNIWNRRTPRGSTWAIRCLFPLMRSNPLTPPQREDPLHYSFPEFLTMSGIDRSGHSHHRQLWQMCPVTLVTILFILCADFRCSWLRARSGSHQLLKEPRAHLEVMPLQFHLWATPLLHHCSYCLVHCCSTQ